MPQSQANARWGGGALEGAGTVSLGSGAMVAQPYGFATRMGQGVGTDPEELAAAAHASCFSMALAMVLQAGGMVARFIDAEATVTLGQEGGGPAVTRSHLAVTVSAPGVDPVRLREACDAAKEHCPISRLYRTGITMELRLLEAVDLMPVPSDGGADGSRIAALPA